MPEVSGLNILLIEDSDDHAELVRRAFARSRDDFNLIRAASCSSASELLESIHPSVIISDYILPDGNGLNLYKQHLKVKYPGVPVILLTSQGDELVAADAIKSGITDYIVKSDEILISLPDVCRSIIRENEQILENKRNVEALRESEDIYRSIIQTAMDGVWLTDTQGNLIEVNKSYCKMSGYTEHELLSMTIPELEAKESAEETAAHMQTLIKNGESSFESLHRRKDGTVYDVEINIKYRPEKGGQCVVFIRDITARKKAEELKYRALFDQAAVGVAQIDSTTGQFLKINQRYADIVGRTPSEMITLSFKDITHPDDLDIDLDNMNALLEGRINDFSMQKRYFHKNGSLIWVLLTVTPMWKKGEPPSSHIAVVQDITEGKKAEEQLHETNAYLDNLFNYANAPIIVWDAIFKITRFNKAFEKMTGRTSCDVIGNEISILFPSDQIESSMNLIRSTIVGKRWETVEIPILHINGTVSIVLWNSANIYADDGSAPIATIAQGHDITERKRSERELLESKALLEAVIENVPLMIFLKETTDLRFVIFNRAGEELVGYSRETFLGKNNLELFPPDEAANFMAKDRETLAIESGVVDIPEEPITTAKKGLRFLHTRKVCIRGADGVSKYLLGISEDITDRKRAEEEKRVFEQQLQHAQKLESLGVLSGGIAHDFNNILAIIIGYCGLIKMDYETAEQNIKEIETAAERAAGLCRQMLAYAGKAQLTMTQVNIWMLVDEMVNMLKATLPQNAVIKPELSTNIPNITADASQLRQIVMNLIINASEAIGKEQGEILVSLAKTAVRAGQSVMDYHGKEILPGSYVCLEVSDTGCGMDEETKWRIFEPFYTTKFTGRGLGMSAVLGIINSHDGALQLTSQLGKGTTFKVYLPVQRSDSTEDKSQSESTHSVPWQGSGTILLVEDEDAIRNIAKILLQKFGFTVLEAVNGKEALKIYQKNAGDITLVLTDMGMPVMDGYALLPVLKQLNPKLPIVISSGFGDADVTSRIGTDNIAGLISKPYNPNQLREVIKNALGSDQIITKQFLAN